MRRSRISFSISRCLIASFLLIAAPAVADPEDDMRACATTPAEAAIPFCTRAIQSNAFKGRDLAGIYLNRGLRYDYKGDYDLALADYNQAIEIDPTFAKAFNNRGGTYTKMKDYERAIADFDAAIRLDPNYGGAFTSRCSAYTLKGEYERAIADCNQAIRINPRDALAFFDRGYANYLKKDNDRSISDYSEANRLAPKAWEPLRGRGVAYIVAENYDRAIDDFDAVIRIAPKVADGFYGRGLAKLKKGDTVGGDADIAAAKAIKANIADEWATGFRIGATGIQPSVASSLPPPQAAPVPPPPAQQTVAHVESCTTDSWGFLAFHGYEFGTVNSCQEPVSIWFVRKKTGKVVEATVKGRGVFTTGLDMETFGGDHWGPWISATCPLGYKPSPAVSFKDENTFLGSKYQCVAIDRR